MWVLFLSPYFFIHKEYGLVSYFQIHFYSKKKDQRARVSVFIHKRCSLLKTEFFVYITSRLPLTGESDNLPLGHMWGCWSIGSSFVRPFLLLIPESTTAFGEQSCSFLNVYYVLLTSIVGTLVCWLHFGTTYHRLCRLRNSLMLLLNIFVTTLQIKRFYQLFGPNCVATATFCTKRTMTLTFYNSTVPTAKDVLVPETLLKKRKSDAQAAEKAAAAKIELRKVSHW